MISNMNEIIGKQIKFVPIFIDDGFCLEETKFVTVKSINENNVVVIGNDNQYITFPISWLRQSDNEFIILEDIC